MTAGDPQRADLGFDRRRGKSEHLTERRVAGERELFRAMPTPLTDKKPLSAVIGGGGDPSVSASESARCSNNHQGALVPSSRSLSPTTRARATPFLANAS